MKTRRETQNLAQFLTARFGHGISTFLGEVEDGPYVDMSLTQLDRGIGFTVRTILGWRHVKAQLRFETFAKDLLGLLENSTAVQRSDFSALAAFVISNGGRLQMFVNGMTANPRDGETWPKSWQTLSLEVERGPMMVDHESQSTLDELITVWGGSILGMVLALLPTEQIRSDDQSAVVGYPEGGLERIEVNRYERSAINRALCIATKGTRCAICSFDFERTYGPLGADFIVVHHVIPVSKLGPNYRVNPATDLVPVCPNCHAMLHRRDPPLGLEELRALMPQVQ